MTKRSILRCSYFLGVLLCACSVASHADLGVENTQGPGSYQDSVLNLDADLTNQLNFAIGYEQAASSTSTSGDITKTYTAALTFKPLGHYSFGLNGSNSPEMNDARSTGWGANFSYTSAMPEISSDTVAAGEKEAGPENFTWGFSAAYGANILGEYIDYNTYQKKSLRKGKFILLAVDHSDWYSLKQTVCSPGLTCTLFQLIDLNAGYSRYSYDKDIGIFSQRLTRLSGSKGVKNANFGAATGAIDGFPDNSACAGIAVSPLDCLKLEYAWSRTVYVLDQPQEDSSTFTLYYTVLSTLQLKAAYNILSTNVVYTTLGLKWLWQ